MWQTIKQLLQKNNKFDPEVMAQKIEELNYSDAKNHVAGKKFYYRLRNFWGILLALVLVASVGFQFWLTYSIGKGTLDFVEYKNFLTIIAGENFIQVLGLCYIVVNYLFPKQNGGK